MSSSVQRFLLGSGLLLTLGVVAGCGEQPSGRATGGVTAGGKGDNTEQDSSDDDSGGELPMSDHRGATLQCEAVADHLREHVNVARVDAVVDLERDRNDCLVHANDGARERIDAKLTAAGDPYMGQTDRTLRSHRDGAVAACNALVEAAPEAAGDALAGIATACIAGIELHLALVLDAWVDFGVAPFSIPAARDRYPSCYAELDTALAEAPGSDPTAEEAAAQASLADCIIAVHDALVPELAARVVATFPGREPATVESEISDALLALHETRGTLCEIAVHAGPSAGTPEVELEVSECWVDVAIQAGEMILWIAPELLPDDGELAGSSSDGGSSEGSSSDDGGFESSSSTSL